jgi:uncharacterized protein (DUF2384 family)
MAYGDTSDFFDCRAAADLLTSDLRRVARTLGLDAELLSRVLVMDAGLAGRLLDARARISPTSPEGIRAVRLVRLNRALGDAFGSIDAVGSFLHEADPDDGLVPIELLQQPDGIERVFARMDCSSADEWRPRAGRGPQGAAQASATAAASATGPGSARIAASVAR